MNKSIAVIPFKDIENAYVVISCFFSENHGNNIKKNMSFFYDNGEVGAEWEPENGPITKIFKCDKDYEAEHENAQKHYFYDYCTGYGHWSQLAVDKNRLPEYFLDGNYEMIFSILKSWAE